MKVQAICNGGIALITDFEELGSGGAEGLNGQATADMIRRGFLQLGMEPLGEIDVEAYINGRAVLIFACISRREAAAVCRFEEIEEVIAAAHAVREMPSDLIFCGGEYYLALYGAQAEKEKNRISEYGGLQESPALYCRHLREVGRVLCEGNALEKIRTSFKPIDTDKSLFAGSLHQYE